MSGASLPGARTSECARPTGSSRSAGPIVTWIENSAAPVSRAASSTPSTEPPVARDLTHGVGYRCPDGGRARRGAAVGDMGMTRSHALQRQMGRGAEPAVRSPRSRRDWTRTRACPGLGSRHLDEQVAGATATGRGTPKPAARVGRGTRRSHPRCAPGSCRVRRRVRLREPNGGFMVNGRDGHSAAERRRVARRSTGTARSTSAARTGGAVRTGGRRRPPEPEAHRRTRQAGRRSAGRRVRAWGSVHDQLRYTWRSDLEPMRTATWSTWRAGV